MSYAYTDYRDSSVSFDYRTTSTDHLTSYQGNAGTATPYLPYGGEPGRLDKDGRQFAEFDSGRQRHKPRRAESSSSSEFVVGSVRQVGISSAGQHRTPLRQTYSFVPSSSYHTHSDQRHPRQELITTQSAPIRSHVNVPVSRVQNGHEPVRRRSRGEERHSPQRRKRSVSPQITREHHVVEQRIPQDNSRQQQHYEKRKERQVPDPLNEFSQYSDRHYGIQPSSPPRLASQRNEFRRKKIDMSIQASREDSFITHQPVWRSTVPYLLLVLSGFFFTGQEDIVKCFACMVEIGNWKRIDNVHERHFNRCPNCPHLRKEYLSVIIQRICPKLLHIYSDFGYRYTSFRNWPIPRKVSGKRLAEAGFFYKGRDIQTQCYSCGVMKDDWKEGEDPFTVHFALCSTCPHITQLTSKKVYKVEYKTREDRLKSFKSMPLDVPVDKEELVDAGFVLIRPPFTVQCPECEVIVEDWKEGDNPLKKHLKLNEDCPFVKKYMETYEHSSEQHQILDEYKHDYQASFEDQSPSDDIDIQFPPSLQRTKSTLSSSSSESVSLPTQSSFDKEETAVTSAQYKRTLSHEDDSKLCIVCFENSKECAIIPCGHWCVCLVCADKLKHCPVCRQRKHNVLKIFIP